MVRRFGTRLWCLFHGGHDGLYQLHRQGHILFAISNRPAQLAARPASAPGRRPRRGQFLMMGPDTLERFRLYQMTHHGRVEQQRRAYRHGRVPRLNQAINVLAGSKWQYCWQEWPASERWTDKRIWKKDSAVLSLKARLATQPHTRLSPPGSFDPISTQTGPLATIIIIATMTGMDLSCGYEHTNTGFWHMFGLLFRRVGGQRWENKLGGRVARFAFSLG